MRYKIIVALLAISIYCIQGQFFDENTIKLNQVINYIGSDYVDSVDTDEIVQNAILKMLEDLDPHSAYISKEEVNAMNEPLEGSFEGIGIMFNILEDTILVVSPISGGPSEKVGLMAGDRIMKINGQDVAGVGITNNEVQKKLKGPKGTQVDVSIKRRKVKRLLEFTITRDIIPINSIDAAYMIEDGIGYVKINRFALTTMKEFYEALAKMKNENTSKIILDLSGNGGGYLNVAFWLADEFLSNDRMIVYTEGLNSPRQEYKATKAGMLEDSKVVVIIDEGSASASEILSGALQDWDHGIIIGRRSFGKGLVQKQYELNDGSMIRLTIARYYTPTGRLIQKPYENGLTEYGHELIERYKRGESFNRDSIHFPDSLKYKTLVEGRTVYGGGGIMPDIFIPLDTSNYSDYYRELIGKGMLNQFVLTYLDQNRGKLKKEYTTFEDFNARFMVTSKMIEEMVEYAENHELETNRKDLAISEEQLKLIIKASIARDIWTTNEFYQIINSDSHEVKKAIEILKNWDSFRKVLTGK
jgi:carboxyl-terminal processing protease